MAIQQAQTPPPPKRMQLSAVTRGRVEKPIRVLLYGVEGVGKSTFAASAPSPIFLAAEDGTAHLDAARFPEPRSWGDALEAVEELMLSDHDYKTLVIDTLDWLEPLCWSQVVSRGGAKIKSIEDFGFGKGYVAALDEWRILLAKLEALRSRKGMHVVLLAHSWIKTFKNPEDDDFDRYELKLHAKAGGLIKEWTDAVVFGRYETFAAKDEKTKRVRGVSSGERVMHTQRTAAWDAKNRYDLPATLPLSWDAFAEAIAAHRPADPAKLRERISGLLEGASDDIKARVSAAVAKAGDDSVLLSKIAGKLAAESAIKEQEQGQ